MQLPLRKLQCAFRFFLSCAHHDKIVHKTHQPQPLARHRNIERVEIDVRQQRRERASLRYTTTARVS